MNHSSNFSLVGEFARKFGLTTFESRLPGLLDHEEFLFRLDLIMEEANEILRAHRNGDVVKLADGIADLLYVTYGLAHECGIPIDHVFREVHRSNMLKERSTGDDDRRSTRGSRLDVVKPVGWEPPDVAGELFGTR